MTTKLKRFTDDELDQLAANFVQRQQEEATPRERAEDRLLRSLDAAAAELQSYLDSPDPADKPSALLDVRGVLWNIEVGRDLIGSAMHRLYTLDEARDSYCLLPLHDDDADKPVERPA